MTDIKKEGGFEIDWTDFNRRFFEYATRTAPAAAEQGMWRALGELKHDVDTVTPKAPLLEGNLRGDFDLVLEGITTSKVVSSGSKGNARAVAKERIGAKGIVVKLILRMPYAAKWHEAVGKKVNWSEAGVGPKYMERKMQMFAKKYFNIVSDVLRSAAGGGR